MSGFLVVVVVIAVVWLVLKIANDSGNPLGAPRDPFKRIEMLYTDYVRLSNLVGDPFRAEWKKTAERKAMDHRIQEIHEVLRKAENDPNYQERAKAMRIELGI